MASVVSTVPPMVAAPDALLLDFGAADIGRVTLAVGEPGDPVVYAFAATAGDGAQSDLFRSKDGGQTWTPLGLAKQKPVNPNPEQPDMNIMADQAFYNQMLLVDPSDAARNTVYIGGQLSSAKTHRRRATWRIISNWLAQFGLPYVHADFHAAAASPPTKSILCGYRTAASSSAPTAVSPSATARTTASRRT